MKKVLKKNLKPMTIKVPFENWKFLKRSADDQDLYVNDIINHLIEKYKNKLEKHLDM